MLLHQTSAKLFDSSRLDPFYALFLLTSMQYSIPFCTKSKAASDVISGTFGRHRVPDNTVKFSDPG